MEIDRTAALAALRHAIRLEVEGRDFYTHAAHTTEDEKGVQTFLLLAKDEGNHLELLQKQYDSLKDTGTWTDFSQLPRQRIDLDRPIFPRGMEEIEKTVEKHTTELDALLFGLNVETRSYDLYRQAARETPAPQARAMYEFLAAQEQDHFNILMMRYEGMAGPVGWRY
ncbi:MAG: ferritin family protein [Chloroflexi bacterium]|nr:ferritin family protein [Chloroflexota bacterium]